MIADEDAYLSDPLWAWVTELEAEYRKRVLAVATARQAILVEREWAIGYLQLREGWLDDEGNIKDPERYVGRISDFSKNMSKIIFDQCSLLQSLR